MNRLEIQDLIKKQYGGDINAFYKDFPTEESFIGYMQNGGSKTRKLSRKKQEGGSQDEQEQLMQIIEAYSRLSGEDSQTIMGQLQSVSPEEQQAMISQMVEAVQQAMAEQQSMEEESEEYEQPAEASDVAYEEMMKSGGYIPVFPTQPTMKQFMKNYGTPNSPVGFYKCGGSKKQSGGTMSQPSFDIDSAIENKMSKFLSTIQDLNLKANEEEVYNELMTGMARYGKIVPRAQNGMGVPGGNGGNSNIKPASTNTSQNQISEIIKLMNELNNFNKQFAQGVDNNPYKGGWMTTTEGYPNAAYRYRNMFPQETFINGSRNNNVGINTNRNFTWNKMLSNVVSDINKTKRTGPNGEELIPSISLTKGRRRNPTTIDWKFATPPGNYKGAASPGRQGFNADTDGDGIPDYLKINQFGGELFLTDKEIDSLKKGGYTIEYLD